MNQSRYAALGACDLATTSHAAVADEIASGEARFRWMRASTPSALRSRLSAAAEGADDPLERKRIDCERLMVHGGAGVASWTAKKPPRSRSSRQRQWIGVCEASRMRLRRSSDCVLGLHYEGLIRTLARNILDR